MGFAMTDEEKRQQKAMLLLEAQEAEEEIAHLREKAIQRATKLREVAQWLEDAGDEGWSPEIAEKREERERKITASTLQYDQALNFPHVVDLVSQIKDARRKRGEFHARKTALGLK